MLDHEWGNDAAGTARAPSDAGLLGTRTVAQLHARVADEVEALVRRATWFELASATARAHREVDALAPSRHRSPQDAASSVLAEERLRLLAGSLRGATAQFWRTRCTSSRPPSPSGSGAAGVVAPRRRRPRRSPSGVPGRPRASVSATGNLTSRGIPAGATSASSRNRASARCSRMCSSSDHVGPFVSSIPHEHAIVTNPSGRWTTWPIVTCLASARAFAVRIATLTGSTRSRAPSSIVTDAVSQPSAPSVNGWERRSVEEWGRHARAGRRSPRTPRGRDEEVPTRSDRRGRAAPGRVRRERRRTGGEESRGGESQSA